jgi:hypothetical protein
MLIPTVMASRPEDCRCCTIHDWVGNPIQSHSGKAIRLLTSTGIGSIPIVGPMAGILAGVVDSFFLETMLPKFRSCRILEPFLSFSFSRFGRVR